MKILLTGGSGFIGKNILESYLINKYEILAPKHKDMDLLNEVAVENFFLENKIDVVIHSAVKPGHRNAKDLNNLFYSNTRMFFNLNRMSNTYKKMLVIGSGAIYDMRYYKPKTKEEDYNLYLPDDEHGFCKYICGKYIEKSDNIIDLRVFGIFGKYEDYAIRFISNNICKAIHNLPLTIKQNKKFDYLYINDLMSILEYFIENNVKHKAYNVTPDKSISLYNLAEKINAITGKNLPIIVDKQGMGLEYSGDNSRLREEMKNFKFTEIDAAITQLYEWYNENKKNINKSLLIIDK